MPIILVFQHDAMKTQIDVAVSMLGKPLVFIALNRCSLRRASLVNNFSLVISCACNNCGYQGTVSFSDDKDTSH